MAVDWNERYRSRAGRLWSGRVNDVVLDEVPGLTPGRALDVGCGEGADAIWLARQGWTVTGLDISSVALERAAAAAQEAGVTVEWVCGDLLTHPVPAAAFDLVSLQYPALPHAPGDPVLRALIGAVAPGGTLLVVGHGPPDPDFWRGKGMEPDEYVQVADVTAALGDGWTVEVDGMRPRHELREGIPWTHDVVLRARRA